MATVTPSTIVSGRPLDPTRCMNPRTVSSSAKAEGSLARLWRVMSVPRPWRCRHPRSIHQGLVHVRSADPGVTAESGFVDSDGRHVVLLGFRGGSIRYRNTESHSFRRSSGHGRRQRDCDSLLSISTIVDTRKSGGGDGRTPRPPMRTTRGSLGIEPADTVFPLLPSKRTGLALSRPIMRPCAANYGHTRTAAGPRPKEGNDVEPTKEQILAGYGRARDSLGVWLEGVDGRGSSAQE